MPDDLRSLALDVPLLTDRVLLELANSMVVAEDLTTYRREQSFSGTLLARIVGRERQRELLTTRALVDGQRSLVHWATELSGQSRISDLALARVAECLGETRRRVEEASGQSAARLSELADVVARIAEACEIRFTEAESRLAALEEHQAATELGLEAEHALAISVGRWTAGQSYNGLPWPVQVVLLSAEVAAGPAGAHSFRTGRDAYVERLVHAVLNVARPDTPKAASPSPTSSTRAAPRRRRTGCGWPPRSWAAAWRPPSPHRQARSAPSPRPPSNCGPCRAAPAHRARPRPPPPWSGGGTGGGPRAPARPDTSSNGS